MQAMSPLARWRVPALIILAGCAVSLITFGPRSTVGLFLQPMSQENAWGRDVFGLAVAIQNLLWGAGQPLAGAIADRFGQMRVLAGGVLLYAAGLAMMAYATTPGSLYLSAGVLIGFGLSGASTNIVVTAFAKLLPESHRSFAFGAGTAAGSFGQFLFSPLCVALLGAYGWRETLIIFAITILFVLPFTLFLETPGLGRGGVISGAPKQSFRDAMAEAFGHRSYVLLVIGFYTCGFHVAFITTHLPPYLVDKGLDARTGAWVLALIGLFNIIGSLGSGWLGSRYQKRYILAWIYFLRGLVILAFLLAPISQTSALLFGAGMGLLWLSTVAPTSGLIALMFGTNYMATLFGFVFFSHQLGSFTGVWLGGLLYERTGSYDTVWWLGVALGIAAALVHLPISEKPVERPIAAPA